MTKNRNRNNLKIIMDRRITLLLVTGVLLIAVAAILLCVSATIDNIWWSGPLGFAGLAFLGLGLNFFDRAVRVAEIADECRKIQEEQIINIMNMLNYMRNPRWFRERMRGAYPKAGNFMSDLEYDADARAWHLRESLYTDGFISAWRADTRGESAAGKEGEHECV